MKEHGFGKALNKDYALIIKAWPYDTLMRERQAREINKFGGKNLIEFGCGSGEATKQIIKYNPKLKILATDNDSNVIKNAKNNIKFDTVQFKTLDAFKYNPTTKYDIVTSAHFLHNFEHEKQIIFLKSMYDTLKTGGLFIILDKVWPDDPNLRKEYWKRLKDRFKIYDKHNRSDLKKIMLEHETMDRDKSSILIETEFKNVLKKVGFKDIKLVLRKEQDIVLTAKK